MVMNASKKQLNGNCSLRYIKSFQNPHALKIPRIFAPQRNCNSGRREGNLILAPRDKTLSAQFSISLYIRSGSRGTACHKLQISKLLIVLRFVCANIGWTESVNPRRPWRDQIIITDLLSWAGRPSGLNQAAIRPAKLHPNRITALPFSPPLYNYFSSWRETLIER